MATRWGTVVTRGLVLVSVAGALSACGDDSTSSTSSVATAATAAATTAPTAPSTTAAPTTIATTTTMPVAADYTIVAGDTLSAVAKKLGVNLQELIALNGITNPDRIVVGQKLKVPPTTAPTTTAKSTTTTAKATTTTAKATTTTAKA